MRRTPAAGLLEYIIPLLYLPVFTIWVSATKQASHTHKLFSVWVSAIKQASHTHKLFSAWVSAAKQASHTLKLFIVWVSATKQASHTLKLSTAWVSATKQASHTHKLFTLRQKKGTEKLDPISCAHVEAEEGAQAEFVLSTARNSQFSSPRQACAVPLPPALWSGSGCHGFPVLRRLRRSSRYHPGIRSLLPSIHNVSKAIDRSPVPA